jgi:hypothetical protein
MDARYAMISLVAFGLFGTAIAAPEVTVTSSPAKPLIERTKAGQSVSVDLIVTNTLPAALVLDELRVQVLDAKDIILHDRIAESGLSGAFPVETRIAAKTGTLLVLNPFHTFPANLPLAKLRFTLTFHEDTKAAPTRRLTYDVAPSAYVNKTRLRVPVKGRVIVQEGHDFLAHHRRVDLTNAMVKKLGVTTNPTRYSYDFISVDAKGSQHKSAGGTTNEDWVTWGAPVLAPAAGTVIEVRDGTADNVLSPAGNKMFDFKLVLDDIKNFYGNFIVIEHAKGEVSVLAHLQNGSLKVKTGDKVRAGQELAKIGMSGDADRPHLHYQLQSGFERNSEPLPSYFAKLRYWRGATSSMVADTTPDSGDIIEGE